MIQFDPTIDRPGLTVTPRHRRDGRISAGQTTPSLVTIPGVPPWWSLRHWARGRHRPPVAPPRLTP